MLADLTSNFITSASSTLEQLSYRWGQLPQSPLLHPEHGISIVALTADPKRTVEQVADRDRLTLASITAANHSIAVDEQKMTQDDQSS